MVDLLADGAEYDAARSRRAGGRDRVVRTRYSSIYLVPGVLASAGPAFLVAVTGRGFLPLAVAWWAAAVAVAAVRSGAVRLRVCLALIPICVLTTFEGGLFMLPAVAAMCAIELGRGSARASRSARHAAR
jgi:hypothetical protein